MSIITERITETTPCPRLWAEINLDAVEHNYNAIRAHVGMHVKIMAMVKSNAYGHSSLPVAALLQQIGADYFGVANVEEALELRSGGITIPIAITGPITACEIEPAIANEIDITLTPPDLLDAIEAEAERQQRVVRLHLMLDVGMTRCGLGWDSMVHLAERLKTASKYVQVAGVATHLPVAEDSARSKIQLMKFDKICDSLRELGVRPQFRHAANTVGIFNVPGSHYDMVRPGIGLFGMYPDECLRAAVEFKPAMSVHTQVCYVREVGAGVGIGYGHTYRTAKPTKIATLPIGYADGFQRSLSNQGRVIIAGQYAKVVGNVSMDMLTIDVGHIENVQPGMPVTIIGSEGDIRITAEEHAQHRGTIPYEVTCLIGKRVQRIFIRHGISNRCDLYRTPRTCSCTNPLEASSTL